VPIPHSNRTTSSFIVIPRLRPANAPHRSPGIQSNANTVRSRWYAPGSCGWTTLALTPVWILMTTLPVVVGLAKATGEPWKLHVAYCGNPVQENCTVPA
jgi:hypothetical protein